MIVQPIVDLHFLETPLTDCFDGGNFSVLDPFVNSPFFDTKIIGDFLNCH